MILIMMGVAGAGKTTVGQQLAATLGWQFLEGDTFHPPENVAKMSQGVPLTDGDRAPWLTALRHEIEQIQTQGASAVIACSALKQRYREILQGNDKEIVKFVYLQGHPTQLRLRLAQRQGHFMKSTMLDSQLAILEVPQDAIVIDADKHSSIEAVVKEIDSHLKGEIEGWRPI